MANKTLKKRATLSRMERKYGVIMEEQVVETESSDNDEVSTDFVLPPNEELTQKIILNYKGKGDMMMYGES